MELIFVVPLFLLVTTGVTQLALASAARLLVRHAAAAAARAAIVVLPAQEERRPVSPTAIRDAAAYVMAPLTRPRAPVVTSIENALEAGGLAGERGQLAEAFRTTGVIVDGGRAWNAPITVRVVHAFRCRVPIGNAALCRPAALLPPDAQADLARAGVTTGDGYWLVFRASQTLPKQGRPR